MHATFINVSFRAYLRHVINERLRNVVTTYANERCFEYVYVTFVKRFQRTFENVAHSFINLTYISIEAFEIEV